MSTEETVVTAVEPAPEQETTAVPVTDASAPESESKEQAKTFTQEEVDALIGKRLAREQRKWEREQAHRAPEQPRKSSDTPSIDNFESPEAYAEALAAKKAEELLAKREAELQAKADIDSFYEKEEDARTKYEDFERVAYNPRLRITETMAEVIRASDIGPDVLYFLGSNPKEADRISKLSPFLQAKEIGRLETKVSSEPPPTKKVSTAPAPINPVASRSASSPVLDTTDPRSVKSMSTSEWIEAERKRQIKKLETQIRK